MAADNPTPLCTWPQFSSGRFSDLGREISDPQTQLDILVEATRLAEGVCDRRLAPFTGLVETCRAVGVDPEEYPGAMTPTTQASALGMSYASALGGDDGVRRVWVEQYAPRYPEMWAYSGVSVSIGTTYGGSGAATGFTGPDPDTGYLWLSAGAYVPVGSLVKITYGGGYQTYPADLVRAGKLMTAWVLMRELAPTKQTRDPNSLWDDASRALAGYIRE